MVDVSTIFYKEVIKNSAQLQSDLLIFEVMLNKSASLVEITKLLSLYYAEIDRTYSNGH